MVSMISEEGRTKVGIYEYVIDTATELSQVPTDVQVGSIVYCIENSKKYMLDSSGNYVEVNFKKGGSGGEAKLGTKDIDENGSYKASDFNLDGWSQVNVNISSGGGASNIIGDSFTTRSDTGYQDITVPYTGEGYPIECVIVPHGGTAEWAIYQSYRGISVGYLYKQKYDTAPSYHSTNDDKANLCLLYGSSGYDGNRSAGILYGDSSATQTFMDKNTLRINVGSSAFLFLPNTSYDYFIRYSE